MLLLAIMLGFLANPDLRFPSLPNPAPPVEVDTGTPIPDTGTDE